MKSSAKNVKLASVDDLFTTEESRADASREKVVEIPLSELHPFKDHPFKVKDDEAMMETADSIRQYGVLVPAIVRPDADGGYELVAGHRRHHASELAGKETLPCMLHPEKLLLPICRHRSRLNLLRHDRDQRIALIGGSKITCFLITFSLHEAFLNQLFNCACSSGRGTKAFSFSVFRNILGTGGLHGREEGVL